MQSNSKLVLLLVWLWTLLPLAASQSTATTTTTTTTSRSSSSGLKYSDVTFIGAHNSLCVRTQQNAFSTFGNQFYNVSVQLDAGVRMVQGQGFLVDGEIHICHTSCSFFDGGKLVDHLNEIKAWMAKNPSEIVTLLWVNSDNMSPTEFDKAYKQAGMDTMSYVPTGTGVGVSDWPLVSDMVTSGKRVVSFLAQSANQQLVPYLLDEFTYIFETPFEVTSPTDFGCTQPAGRGKNPDTSMALVNHFLDTRITDSITAPNVSYASVSNSAGPGVGNLGDHAKLCKSTFGRRVNFLLLDFIDRGDPFSVADSFNSGPKPSRVAPAPIPATDAAGTTGGYTSAAASSKSVGSRFSVHAAVAGILLFNLFYFVF